MLKSSRMKVQELNPHLTCVLCGGYLIDATTIVECLHSFCRTCIVHYLHTSNYCPVCECLVHKKYPHQNLRDDKMLQDVVYKLVPGLFTEEMKRRRCYYDSATDDSMKPTGVAERIIFSPSEKISLCMQFCTRGIKDNQECEFSDKRYLLCPADLSVYHLKKFIRLKYSLSDRLEIEIFYSDEVLQDDYSLVDVSYITGWKREKVLVLNYAFYENPAKKLKRSVSLDAVSPGNDDSGIEDESSNHDVNNQEAENISRHATPINDNSVHEGNRDSVDNRDLQNKTQEENLSDIFLESSDDVLVSDRFPKVSSVKISKHSIQNDSSDLKSDDLVSNPDDEGALHIDLDDNNSDKSFEDSGIQMSDSSISERYSSGFSDLSSTEEKEKHQTDMHSPQLTCTGSYVPSTQTFSPSEKESSCSNFVDSSTSTYTTFNDSGAQTSPCPQVEFDSDEIWTDGVMDLSKPKTKVQDPEVYEEPTSPYEDVTEKYTYMVDGFCDNELNGENCNGLENDKTSENNIPDSNVDKNDIVKMKPTEPPANTKLQTSVSVENSVKQICIVPQPYNLNKGKELSNKMDQSKHHKKRRKSSETSKSKLIHEAAVLHWNDKHSKCTEICNGHSVKPRTEPPAGTGSKPRSEKLVVKLSKERDSENYTATMS